MRQSRSRSQMLLEEESAQRRQTAPKRSPILSTRRKESWLKRRSSWGVSTLESSKAGGETVYGRDQRDSTLGPVHHSLEKGQGWSKLGLRPARLASRWTVRTRGSLCPEMRAAVNTPDVIRSCSECDALKRCVCSTIRGVVTRRIRSQDSLSRRRSKSKFASAVNCFDGKLAVSPEATPSYAD